jgi:hypothetical protein
LYFPPQQNGTPLPVILAQRVPKVGGAHPPPKAQRTRAQRAKERKSKERKATAKREEEDAPPTAQRRRREGGEGEPPPHQPPSIPTHARRAEREERGRAKRGKPPQRGRKKTHCPPQQNGTPLPVILAKRGSSAEGAKERERSEM